MSPLEKIPSNSINLPLDTIVPIVTLIIFAVYIIFSAVLYYHWSTYSTDDKVQGITLLLYFLLTVPLILVLAIIAFIIV